MTNDSDLFVVCPTCRASRLLFGGVGAHEPCHTCAGHGFVPYGSEPGHQHDLVRKATGRSGRLHWAYCACGKKATTYEKTLFYVREEGEDMSGREAKSND